ncbi:TPA: hypothetical protein ACPUGO_005084 [Klebsiella pneumoniae]
MPVETFAGLIKTEGVEYRIVCFLDGGAITARASSANIANVRDNPRGIFTMPAQAWYQYVKVIRWTPGNVFHNVFKCVKMKRISQWKYL